MPKTVKGGPLRFYNIHSDANFQKIEGGPYESLKYFRKKMRNINGSLIVPKNLKKGSFGIF